MYNILVHYDVSDHYVQLDTFVASAKAAQASVRALNQFYFSNQIEFELVVVAPESGSLKQYIGVALKGVTWTTATLWMFFQVMDSDTVQDLSREFFGSETKRNPDRKVAKPAKPPVQ